MAALQNLDRNTVPVTNVIDGVTGLDVEIDFERLIRFPATTVYRITGFVNVSSLMNQNTGTLLTPIFADLGREGQG